MTDTLIRCADCRFNPGAGWHCVTGNRPARGHTRLKCSSFMRRQPASLRVPWHSYCVITRRDTIGLVVEFVKPRPQ